MIINNKNAAIGLFILVCNIFAYSQKYPTNYFRNPVDIPVVLAATFGELRTDHFHAGIDIKTLGKEGLPIVAAADGYVSRIKIQHWGYGKALYVTHPNGYVSVYAHLQKFSPEIEAFVKKNQYKKESYTIQLYPEKNLLKVKKGKLVAYGGNSGGSFGPHLHFEIRDGKTAKIINPLLFGIEVKDTKKPTVLGAYVYPLDDFARVNQSSSKQKLSLTKQKNGNFLADKIIASGTIGFGIQSFDRLNEAMNKNGIYKLEMYVNKEKVYQHKLETFSFAEGKYVNLLVDYGHYIRKNERIQQCFIVPNNRLSIYDKVVKDGNIFIRPGMNYSIEIVASDIKGNKTKVTIPVQGKEQKVVFSEKTKEFPYHFKRHEYSKVSKGIVTIAIPKWSFYQNTDFDFSYEKGIAKIHNPSVPLHKSITISFDVSTYTKKEQTKLFIGRVKDNGYVSYVNTKRKENKLYTLTRKLGNYKLASDTEKPTISAKNFKNKQKLTNLKYLKINIKDDLSGIKRYRATVDGKWILMEYESKKNLLTYDFSDNKIPFSKTKEHKLKIVVTDAVGNTNTHISTFFR